MIPFLFRFRRWKAVRDAERLLPVASPAEEARARELKAAFAALPVAPVSGVPAQEADWNGAMNRLRELGSSADPRAFLRWDVIIARMAHVGSPATPVELAALQADPAWETRWKDAVRELPVGLPIPYAQYPESSEVLIQAAFHTRELERMSATKVSEWDVVVEFGGGYGGLCRLMHALGFRGRYLIFDLAPFTLLQRYYLDSVGLDTADVTLTSEWSELESFVSSIDDNAGAVFWATWSLSETPRVVRDRIAPLVSRIGNYCVAFQGEYGDIDNAAYFSDWVPGDKLVERITHRPNDYYLVGRTDT